MVAKGPMVTEEIEIADHVLFSGYTGDHVALADGGIFYVIPEQFIVAILQDSRVVLFDSETVKRIIQERFGELRTMQRAVEQTVGKDWFLITDEIERSLLDRIDSFTTSEGFMF